MYVESVIAAERRLYKSQGMAGSQKLFEYFASFFLFPGGGLIILPAKGLGRLLKVGRHISVVRAVFGF